MALQTRLGYMFGKTAAAAVAVAATLLVSAPANAGNDVRVIIGIPAGIGLFFGLPARPVYDYDYRRSYYADRHRDYRPRYRERYRDRWDGRHRHRRHYDRRGPTYEADRHHP